VIGGYSFFERREIRDLLAYVRVLVNPRDASAFARIVKTPPKGIGETTLDRLANYAARKGISLPDACREADHVAGLKKKQITALRDFRLLLDEMAQVVSLPPQQGLAKIIELTEYRKFLEESGTDDPEEAPYAVVDEFLASAQTFQFENPQETLVEFVESISLSGAIDERDDEQDVVTVMTLHAAKGLEFPVVFLVAFEDGILPHQRAVEERGEEEERRLVFVGITRAREELLISYVRNRLFQGSRRFSSPSPFLLELPADNVDRHDVIASASYSQSGEFDEYANQESGYEEPSIPVYRSSRDPSPSDRYHKGMWVRHHEYGDGLILQIEGEGAARKATVHFTAAGTKRFVLEKASLQPMA
jgi:DNA helicase-2/ATP-dependent DNA helicase PcrA